MRLRNMFCGKKIDREMIEETQLHVERAVERLVARGLSPDEARLAARREFGNVGVLQEEGRDARAGRWVESMAGDIRFALRYFARKPLTTTTIILVLSIGIGIHAAAFSLIQSVTMRPAPGLPRDDALVAIRGKQRFDGEAKWRPRAFSYQELRDFVDQRDIFASVAAWSRHSVALDAGDSDGRWAQVQFVTSGFFSTLGIRPILGADLPFEDHPETNGPRLVAVIGHAFWSASFGSSPEAIGKTVRVNDVAVRIVGVAPPRFTGAVPTGGTLTLWMPLSARTLVSGATAHALASRDSAIFEVVGRLRAGASLADANAAVRVIGARSIEDQSRMGGVTHAADVVALRGETNIYADKEIAVMAATYEAMALLVLLITCTNVSALVVSSGAARRHEIAVRLSLGASRGRLIRQLLTESSLLALAGGALGLLVYWWIAKLLVVRLPRHDIVPDATTVAFTLCFALGTGILFGLSPAFHATRRGAADALKDSGATATGRSRLQRVFVIAQIALTQPLLVALAVTLAIVFQDSQRGPNADVADRTISVAFNAVDMVQGTERELGMLLRSGAYRARAARADAAMQRVAALPGVVGVIRSEPGYTTMEVTVASEDRSAIARSSTPVSIDVETTSPGYFALLDIPIVRGRDFVATDTVARDVPLVIGSDLAHDLWPNEDAIGKRFDRQVGAKDAPQRYVVVGVYDSRHGMAGGSQPRVYAPMNASLIVGYLIRTVGPAAPVISSVRSMIQAEVPRISMRLETLAERDEANRDEALRASGAAGGGGVLALLLASIGLYGVVALALGQRRREIGVRIALGARPQHVVRMLFWSGLRLSFTGLLLGLPLSIVAVHVAAAELTLPNVDITVVGAAIALVVIAVASIATWLPARHAATVHPMIILRAD
jgi:putative ABC transport system permease protein